MPKEIIHSKYHGTSENPEPTVRVGWSREAGHVELATIMSDEFELRPTPEGNGWFAQLSREQINHLIRTLRKARDQAYGRDE